MNKVTPARLALASLRYYWRTHAAVVCGQAAAVAVLAGSLLVGHSVRASLSSIASARTGRADAVIAAEQPFTAALADRLRDAAPLAQENASVAAIFSLSGSVFHDASGRRANRVQVYGVDDGFFKLHGVEAAAIGRSDVLVSADLGRELAAADGDTLVLRIVRPTDIPADSMHGRRDDTGRSIRLTARGVLPRARMGDFSLMPQQGPVRAAFISLARLQRDIAQPGRANLLLISAPGKSDTATRTEAALDLSMAPADLGLKAEMIAAPTASADATSSMPISSSTIVETASGLMPDAVARAVTDSATRAGLTSTGVMTWLANRMTVNGRTVPYSLVAAINQPSVEGVSLGRINHIDGTGALPPIALTEWAANDLGARAGDTLELEYYQWTDAGTMETRKASFRVNGVVPMRGLAIDRRLAPDYPGISDAEGLAEWDPPFPVDLKLVRPIDEEFWDQHKTAPKAFIPLADGQALWRSRHGQLSSIRMTATSGSLSADTIDRVLTDATRAVDRASAGITAIDIRSQNAAASAGATDFGAYFSYFSFFLVVSALLLSALFFRLSVEERLPQLGVLRAIGLPLPLIRRVWLIEAAVVAAVGMAAGLVLAIGWAALMMFGLRTWWTGAVGTTLLTLHVDIVSLVAGAAGASFAGLAATAWTVRGFARRSPRRLISGSAGDGAGTPKRSRADIVAAVSLSGAALLAALARAGIIAGEGAFFGAGTLVLIGGLSLMARSLGRGRARTTIQSLAMQNASWRPGRSLTVAGLVASAVFLLIAVDAFRKTPAHDRGRASGTGGFAVVAESAVPIVHDPGTVEGREALGLRETTTDAAFDGAEIMPVRLRPGDDTSCLSLYVPTRPRILGVSARFVEANRFRFARTVASSDAERANPWRLLGPPDAGGVVPAIVDATSLQYVLHARVGDLITVDADTARPVTLRIVGALADSVLQSEVMIAEEAFTRLFPMITGYRVLLAEAAPNATSPARLATLLEERLSPFGVDAVETSAKLDAFHRVENTYLSTFQALGALGLLLGCVGLAAVIARNVLERRRELALLGAFGFTGQQLRTLVTLEHLALVGAGLTIGVAAAVVAVAPLGAGISAAQAGRTFVWLAGVIVMTFVVTAAATRQVRRLPIVSSLRSE